jgi:hypothetical protein
MIILDAICIGAKKTKELARMYFQRSRFPVLENMTKQRVNKSDLSFHIENAAEKSMYKRPNEI